MKECRKCGESRPIECFNLDKCMADGRAARCRDCRQEDRRGWKKRTPEQARIYQLKEKYKLTAEGYDGMLAAQGGTCATCDAIPQGREFAVDHDHSCCPGRNSCGGCIRGILCGPCNKALGWVNDDPGRLLALATYLQK